jgi:hypothetical protein
MLTVITASRSIKVDIINLAPSICVSFFCDFLSILISSFPSLLYYGAKLKH